ncbi:hypothetical protein NLG97_g1796 [Lecanicillium saksenae]|uniref:Uncharacterized protein n=1 Tax=Lecanicillium saksenae TaxID=468837 RepID=A0ACC1R2T0_9HYPO|nr:hypothetical protein NLG97_g1796 [Lecanicillium saksenae]
MSEAELHHGGEVDEDAPLIGLENGDAPSHGPLPQAEESWSQDSVRTLGLMLLASVMYVFGDISRYLSSMKLLSHGVCREYYLQREQEYLDPEGTISEDMCGMPEIQQRIAYISGSIMSLEAGLAFLFTIPYGLMLDRLSERLVLALNITGFLCYSTWLLAVYFFWSVFPVWLAIFGPVFIIVGGGASVFDSATLVVVTRQVPSQHSLITWPAFRNEIKSTTKALLGLVTTPGGLGLIAALPLAKMSDPISEVILLYVQRKFDTSFAYASRVLIFQTLEGLVLLALILPLLVTRFSFALQGIGALTMGCSQTWALYAIGVFIFTFGWGTSPALKSVLTDMVPPDGIAPLYTLIALCDSAGTMAGATKGT